MKILAINGSPRGAAGTTDLLTRVFLDGMLGSALEGTPGGTTESGAEAETVYLKDLRIEHCSGCFTCWTRTPGVCIHKDDMPALLEKIQACDLLIWATPLYVYTVSGLTKDCMDRIIPLAQPFIVRRDGQSRHPARYARETVRRSMVISNCGFPEAHNFDGLKETFRVWMGKSGQHWAGSICCAGGPLLRSGMAGDPTWYLDAVKTAGQQVAAGQPISTQVQTVLDRPLTDDPDAYAEQLNRMWASMGIKEVHHTAS